MNLRLEELAEQIAKEFGITTREVNNICSKFVWYEHRIQYIDKDFTIIKTLKMTWEEFKKYVDIIGPPKVIYGIS